MNATNRKIYSVKQCADLAGVSVRTLHHYDAIGLLKPRSVNASGYRVYGDEELKRLQNILFYRELGFSLDRIRTIVSGRSFDRLKALRSHKEALLRRRGQIDALIRTVERSIESEKGEGIMTSHQLFEGFDVDRLLAEHEKHLPEVESIYDPGLVAESKRRTKAYSKSDWGRIMKEAEEIARAFADLLVQGSPAAAAEVQALAGRHRAHIDRYFYPCSREVYRGLGELYLADARFKAHYEDIAPGLAAYVSGAIEIFTRQA